MFTFKEIFSVSLDPVRRLWGRNATFFETDGSSNVFAILTAAQVDQTLHVGDIESAEELQVNIQIDLAVYVPFRGQRVVLDGNSYTIFNTKKTDSTTLCEMLNWTGRQAGDHPRSNASAR